MFSVTKNEIILAVVFAIGGLLATERSTIAWLGGFDPIAGLAFYYALLYISLAILAHFGLVWCHNVIRLAFIKDEYAKKMGLVKTPAEKAQAKRAEEAAAASALANPDTNSVQNPRWKLVS